MAALFEGFGGFYEPILTAAFRKLITLSQRCNTAMTPGTIDWHLYRKWFDAAGNTNPIHVARVRKTVHDIMTRLQTTDITFINCHGDPLHCAFGEAGRQANLKGYTMIVTGVGMQPVVNPKTGRRHNEVQLIPKPNVAGLTITMYHELSHIVAGTSDARGYDERVCLDLPVHHPNEAIMHAANYGFYARDLS